MRATLHVAFACTLLAACGGGDSGSDGAMETRDSGGAPMGDDAGPPVVAHDAAAPIDAAHATDAAAHEGSAPPPAQPTCTGSAAGAYCGGDQVTNGDPSTLYECPGANKPPSSSQKCPSGCQVNPPGVPDACKVPASPSGYRLPWPAGTPMQLTQDCNDSCCNDHVGVDGYAWDFANGGAFPIVAARGGTVSHLKINSTTGCGSSSCVNDANLIVIDHGDGTQSVYLHAQGMTLAAGVACGGTVKQGQHLATAGTTGWSTGIHLHFQVAKVHTGAPTCECGANGTGCGASTAPWADFWASSAYPTVAIAFDEWPSASQCGNRRIAMPPSQN